MRTDMRKLIFAFSNFAEAPEKLLPLPEVETRTVQPVLQSPYWLRNFRFSCRTARGLFKVLSSKPPEIPFSMACIAAVVRTDNTLRDMQVTAKPTSSVAWLNHKVTMDTNRLLICMEQQANIAIPGIFTCKLNQAVPQCTPYTNRGSTTALHHTATVYTFLGLFEQSGSSWLLQRPPVLW